jgi:gluconate 2-dehydrogenase alpha chain
MKAVDAVTIGVGWTGGIIARELTKAGLTVVGLERGDYRDTVPDFLQPAIHDELAYAVRNKLFQNPATDAMSFRNSMRETALPIRQFSAFLPGDGLGGGSTHWNGKTYRFLATDFKIRSHFTAKYGAAVFGDDCTSQDWPVTYDDLEPYYDRFEYLAGISGKAGNLNGKKIPGGNPFESPRKRDFPNPPLTISVAQQLFTQATSNIGLHPFVCGSANLSRAYKNTEGVQMGACSFCGFCERFGCYNSSKSSLQTALLPVLLKEPKYELRCNSRVMRIEVDSSGRTATGVTYIDANGAEVFQPANMVFVTAFAPNNVYMLLISRIGRPYDPASGQGVIGKNYTYQNLGGATMYFEGKNFNPFMGAGSVNVSIDDYNADNFDHAGLDFVGGGVTGCGSSGGRPILYHPVPPGTPRWGSAWKAAAAKQYGSTFSFATDAAVQGYRGNYLDLDPTYTNAFGQPLLRMTFDWGKHEINYWDFLRVKYDAIAKAIAPKTYVIEGHKDHFNTVGYQSTHMCGGVIMGADPSTSAVNQYQQVWDVPNVFSLGASSFPQNAGYNPTDTVGALAYYTADAVTKHYVKNPGLLT